MFFKKKIKTIDTELNELSQLLFLDQEGSFPKQKVLISIPNDNSIDSLKLIDDYLESIREENELEEIYNSLVLRLGAYVGEVIKSNSKKDYHWYDFKTAKKLQPSIKDWEEQIGTAAILHSTETGEMTFSINKVCKFIDNGSVDSLYSYAKIMI